MIWHIFVEIKQILEEQGEREFLDDSWQQDLKAELRHVVQDVQHLLIVPEPPVPWVLNSINNNFDPWLFGQEGAQELHRSLLSPDLLRDPLKIFVNKRA